MRAEEIIVEQAAELAAWKAKVAACQKLGDTNPPKGKPGNCITRMWAKTGWCPLKKNSENWENVMATLGQREESTGDIADGESPIQCRTGRYVYE